MTLRLAVLLGVMLTSCAPDTAPLDAYSCKADEECGAGRSCIEGYCTGDSSAGDVGSDGDGDGSTEDLDGDSGGTEDLGDDPATADATDADAPDTDEPMDPCLNTCDPQSTCTGAGACLPTCERPWRVWFFTQSIEAPREDSNDYELPARPVVGALLESIEAVLDGDGDTAQLQAEAGRYSVCAIDGVAMWTPISAQQERGRPLLALRPEGGPLILEVPHPFYEAETMDQGREIFAATQAAVLLVSGTHRCANEDLSPCSGVTAACRGTGFRISDPGHSTQMVFHSVHELLARRFPASVVVSFHGHSEGGVVLSDGVRLDADNPLLEGGPMLRLADALAAELAADVAVCRPTADHALSDSDCGVANLQGRLLNYSLDACERHSSEASGRFIHLSQPRDVRERLQPVVDAFVQAFE